MLRNNVVGSAAARSAAVLVDKLGTPTVILGGSEMSGEPLYTVRSAFKVALIAGGLGATVALLIWFEAPSWTWIALTAFCAVVGVVFLAALGHREPEARLRSFVVRTVVLLGACWSPRRRLG